MKGEEMYHKDCGCKVYNGHCVNCHEETYIAEQNYSNDEPIAFSQEFRDKLDKQKQEAKDILDNIPTQGKG
jgi:hypothetical protein